MHFSSRKTHCSHLLRRWENLLKIKTNKFLVPFNFRLVKYSRSAIFVSYQTRSIFENGIKNRKFGCISNGMVDSHLPTTHNRISALTAANFFFSTFVGSCFRSHLSSLFFLLNDVPSTLFFFLSAN